MPPKDGKKAVKSNKPECILPVVVEPLTDESLEFYLNQISDFGYRVERYQARLDQLLDRHDSLRRENDRLLSKKAEVIKVAKRNLSNKVEELRQYRMKIAELEEAIMTEKAEFEEKMEKLRVKHNETESRMRAENDIHIAKLQSLEDFKIARDNLLQTIEDLEMELVEQTQTHRREDEEAAKKRIAAKNKLKRDITGRLTEEADTFRLDAKRNMSRTTRRLLHENFEMNAKLLAVQQDMIDLGVETKQLDVEKLNQLDRIKQCSIEEAKYTLKNITNKKLIEMLTVQRNQHRAALTAMRSRKLPPSILEVVLERDAAVVNSRVALEHWSTEYNELQTLVGSTRDMLMSRMVVRRRLEETLQSVAWALKSAMASDQDPECVGSIYNPMPESRSDTVEGFLRILDCACSMRVGPTLDDLVTPEKLVNRLNRADRIVKSYSLCYQLGDLGLVPRRDVSVPTNRDHVVDYNITRDREMKEMVARSKQPAGRYNYVRAKFYEDLPGTAAKCPPFNMKDLFPKKLPEIVRKRAKCEENVVDTEHYQVTGISLVMSKD